MRGCIALLASQTLWQERSKRSDRFRADRRPPRAATAAFGPLCPAMTYTELRRPSSMALFKTRSAAIYGIDAHLIDVEVDMFSSGNARDSVMVGMPDTAVRESRERIKSALFNSGFGYPNKQFTINLAPANVRKEGAGFDLPVALGILGAMGVVKALDRHIFIGELSLDGAIRPVRGSLSIAVCAREQGITNLIVPAENAAEAAVVEGVNVYGVRNLAEVVALLTRPEEFSPTAVSRNGHAAENGSEPEFREVRGDRKS